MDTISTNKEWFSVSKEGLRKLQLGKPKLYAIRELIQNALDEEVTKVLINATWKSGTAYFLVQDNSPTGFRNMEEAYTLFQPTYKQANPEKRGRFSLGEKQAFSICSNAKITTTKGTIIFNVQGRQIKQEPKLKVGTLVDIEINMSKKEYDDIIYEISHYIIPISIGYYINGQQQAQKMPFKSFKAKLLTEYENEGIMRQISRETEIDLFNESGKSTLYEMGIPVVNIDCDYSINVKQRIPLGIDRETVKQRFLKELFAEVLNNTVNDIPDSSSGASWVRQAISITDRMKEFTLSRIMIKRYGEKALVANPLDPISIDDALANGYHIIRGNEMGKDEWNTLREFDILSTTSDLFKHKSESTEIISLSKLTPDQKEFAELTQKLAKKLLDIAVSVEFMKDPNMVTAQYCNQVVTYNLSKMNIVKPFTIETLAVIFHEIAHEAGHHTQDGYHTTLSEMCAMLYSGEYGE